MMPFHGKTRRIAYDGMMIAFAMIVSYLENLIPVYFGAPGIKPGFANFFIVFLMSQKKYKEAVCVNLCRILLTGFLFGNLFSILYSLAGAVCSFLIMYGMFRLRWINVINISICGGIAHNIGQYLMACIVLKGTDLSYYLPVLLLAGVITGAVNGILTKTVSLYLVRIGRE